MIRREWDRFKMRVIWSTAGFAHVWKTESSLHQWIVLNVASALLAFVLPLTGLERGVLLMGGIMVLAAECMNTAIERVVDDISTENVIARGKPRTPAARRWRSWALPCSPRGSASSLVSWPAARRRSSHDAFQGGAPCRGYDHRGGSPWRQGRRSRSRGAGRFLGLCRDSRGSRGNGAYS